MNVKEEYIDSMNMPQDPVKRTHYINHFFWLCEYAFIPYPHEEKDPQFGLGADVYAHIPSKTAKKYGDRNHALAIWKDLKSGEFVVRKEFREASVMDFVVGNQKGTLITNIGIGKFEEIYRGTDFQEALNQCTIYANKFWGFETEWKACDHSKYMRSCHKKQEGN